MMLHELFGVILIVDASLSLLLPLDKHWLWQLGRLVRLGIGVCLTVM